MSHRFDSYTEGARKTLQLAQEEAQRFKHSSIGTEHILLGLLRDDSDLVRLVFVTFGLQPEVIRSKVEDAIVPGDHAVMGEIGLTPGARRVIELSVDEARILGHHYIGAEHLLLGLLREGQVSDGVLLKMGVNLEGARETIRQNSKRNPNGPKVWLSRLSSERRSPESGQIPARPGSAEQVGVTRVDNVTQRARKSLQLAQEEAQRLKQPAVDLEHMLLGLVREGDGIAARVLNNLGIDSERARAAVETSYGVGTVEAASPLELGPKAMQAIGKAAIEATGLRHHYIGTEHLLLGILDTKDEGITRLLEGLGTPAERVRGAVLDVLGGLGKNETVADKVKWVFRSPTSAKRTRRFDSFTEGARKSLQFAQEEARRFNHNYIGTEHILLGLLRQSDGVAARALNGLGIEPDRARTAIEFIIGRGDSMLMGEIGLTPRAKRVIELALDEARRLNHHYIGTEHLLLGLVREGEGIAAGVLKNLGVSLKKVRAQVIEVLKSSSGYSDYSSEGSDATEEARVTMETAHGKQTTGGQGLTLVMLQTLFDYSIWARDELLPLIEGLSEEERKAGDHKGVYGSIHDTMAHMAQSEWLWIQRCLGDSPLRLPKGEDFPTLISLIDWWNEVHAQAVLYLNSITEADLQTELTYLAPDGKRRTRKIWHMLIQVPNHQTEHRSQIATMLGAIGHEVPPTDMVVYLNRPEAQT